MVRCHRLFARAARLPAGRRAVYIAVTAAAAAASGVGVGVVPFAGCGHGPRDGDAGLVLGCEDAERDL